MLRVGDRFVTIRGFSQNKGSEIKGQIYEIYKKDCSKWYWLQNIRTGNQLFASRDTIMKFFKYYVPEERVDSSYISLWESVAE